MDKIVARLKKDGYQARAHSPYLTTNAPEDKIDGPLDEGMINEREPFEDPQGPKLDTYKGWPIYALPNYTTPYYYPQMRMIKGRKVGGSMEHYRNIKRVHKLIDKWLGQMGKEKIGD